MTANEIEIAVARHFNPRLNVIVPNVYWGLVGLRYEADLVVLRPSGFALEVEIKVTASDIKADTKKRHLHDYQWFRQLWFAVPETLRDHPDIPAKAGILAVSEHGLRPWVTMYRNAKTQKEAKAWPLERRLKLMSLGVMRIWTLKEAMRVRKQRKEGE